MSDLNKIAQAQQEDISVTNLELIAQHEQGPEELRNAVAGLTAQQLFFRPVAGMWSCLEVVCHIADAEQFFADRMKRTISLDHPLLLGVDGFRYPDPLHYQDHELDEELELVSVTRRQMARTLRLLETAAWQRTAVHSETGVVTLRQLLLHAINHVRHHLKFIAEKRAAMNVQSTS